MKVRHVLPFILLLATSAAAQQQAPDPAFLQRAIAALQTQRNQALDNEVAWKAQYDGAAELLAKANEKIKELEAKINPLPPAPK